MVERVSIAGTSLRVSRVAFGCAAMGGYDYGPVDDAESVRAVHRALDLGIDFFDVADVYGFGHAEEVLGRALRGRAVGATIATKVGIRWEPSGRTRRDLSPEWVVTALEGSLRRLGLESIPIYQLHWPDPQTPIAATLEALDRCARQGKIEHVGVCNFSEEQLAEARACMPIVSLQMGYNVVDRQHEPTMRLAARELGMAVLSYNSLAQGLLTGRYDAQSRFAGRDLRQRSAYFREPARSRLLERVEKARAIAQRHRKTVAQVFLRWTLDSGLVSCVLTGIKRPEQAGENAGALGWRLSDDEVREISGPTGDRASAPIGIPRTE